jgi:transcription initiation factor TFIID subunit 11
MEQEEENSPKQTQQIKKDEKKQPKKPEKLEKKEEEESESSLNESLFSEESMYKENYALQSQVSILEMSEADQQRYETFRSSNFPKSAIKKLIGTIIGQAVNPNMVIGVAGLSKVFVGEMVTEAKIVQKELNEDGPLQPSHIHEAYRRLFKKMPNLKMHPRSPWG